MKMRKKGVIGIVIVIGIALGLICLLVILNQPRKARYYVVLYPYGFNHMTSLNQTEFLEHLDIVVDIGFDGVALHNTECFYDEKLLDWAISECQNRNLDVLILIQYFNRSYNFPFPTEAWERRGFITSDSDLALYGAYLKNVSQITAVYPNVKGYIFHYPFNASDWDFWIEQIKTYNYTYRLQYLINCLKNGKPIYMSAELWGGLNSISDVYEYLPKNSLNNVDGFALQGYNTAMDDIQFDFVLKLKNYWKKYFDEIHIGEFGYRTWLNQTYTHGLASSEQSKANMIKEFIRKTWDWNSFVCYFGLTDFPPEGMDYGIIYNNQTLKPSAYAFKEMLKNETS